MTLNIWPIEGFLGLGTLRIDPRVSEPQFSDLPWSNWPIDLVKTS